MSASFRPREITYYDELGVASNATQEEIREAFRALARLLHPDQQTDEQLKIIAERQMRKLNPIYSVLSDPERRRRYDEDLEDGFGPTIIVAPMPEVHSRRWVGRGAWIGAIVLTAGGLIWLSSDSAVPPTGVTHVDAAETPPIPKPSQLPSDTPADEIDDLRSQLKSVTAQRDVAVRELLRLRGNVSAPAASSAEPRQQQPAPERNAQSIAMTELPTLPRTAGVNPPAPRVEPPPVKRRLAGFWFYVKPPSGQKNKNAELYPPEFIEAVITEENGMVRGSYRSRFRIVDRAISPDVNFTFNGYTYGASVTCPWTGPGGARGEITLKLVSENTVRVDWKATELGSQQGLNAGTAVLVRRIEKTD
jgi:hypothetical protein